MRKVAFGFLATALAGVVAVSITAARYQPAVRPNTYVGPVAVGKLLPEDAARKLRVWWETEKRRTFKVQFGPKHIPLAAMTPGQLGLTLDDEATVAQLPTQDFVEGVTDSLSRDNPERLDFEPVYKQVPGNVSAIDAEIRQSIGKPAPARVVFRDGAILRKAETSTLQLDKKAVYEAVLAAVKGDEDVIELPTEEGPKRITDDALAQITDVVSSYSTNFPTYKVTRCANIKLASSKLDGVILLPGERLSFNDTVGRRTIKAGFRIAGVFKNGKHDIDVGGGICQVSTTLYNAAVLANLSIAQRSNHSMAVPYVPLGRDATVDYDSRDLVIENKGDAPVAISSRYTPGRLTFRVLGKKDPELSVKIVQAGIRSWSRGIKLVPDPTLKPGRQKTVDAGGTAHSVTTYRYVYRNGALLKKEVLARSNYPGAPKIVAVGPAAKPKLTPKQAPLSPASAVPATPASFGPRGL